MVGNLNAACLFYVFFDWSKKVANTTPMSAEEYDSGIEKTIPYYSHFYEQTLNLIEAFNYDKARWLEIKTHYLIQRNAA